jgi:hypothetical protein
MCSLFSGAKRREPWIGASHQLQAEYQVEDEDNEYHDPSSQIGFARPSDPLHSEDGDDLLQVIEDVGHENGEEETREILPDNVESGDDNRDHVMESDLCDDAQQGLKEILLHYEIREDSEVEDIIGIFHDYMTASSSGLRLKPLPDRTDVHGR